jgi:hypothetical protein
MERKVTLYNAANVKIGETFTRRARQLVNRQRAAWVDEAQTAIRFYPNMENMDDAPEEMTQPAELTYNQLCFARWRNGYYYPAIIGDVRPAQVRVTFIDDANHTEMVAREHVLSVEDAFNTLDFQGNWRNGWAYFSGTLSSFEPLVMDYDDGDVEQINLCQLRGKPIPRLS